MISRKKLKEQAKKIAFENKSKIWIPIIIYLIAFIVIQSVFGSRDNEVYTFGDTIVSVLSILSSFLIIGYIRYLMALIKKETFEIKDILSYKTIFVSAMVLITAISVFTFLWALLFIIPGIIASIKYSQATYIMAENKNIDPLVAINESKKMMDGHKFEYFVLSLSFMGWFLLSIITVGIALIWLIPYIHITFVLYYENLKSLN